MFDQVAKNIQAIYPIANQPGTVANGVTTNNYQYALPSKNPQIKYFGRFDAISSGPSHYRFSDLE